MISMSGLFAFLRGVFYSIYTIEIALALGLSKP